MLLWLYSTLVYGNACVPICSDRALRSRRGGVSEGHDGRVLVYLAIEQIGDSADEEAVHHEGDGKGGEITKTLADEFFWIANGLKPDRFGWLTPVKVNTAETVTA